MVRAVLRRALPVRESAAGPCDDVRVLPDFAQHPEAPLQRRRDHGQGRSRAQRFARLRAVDKHQHPVLP